MYQAKIKFLPPELPAPRFSTVNYPCVCQCRHQPPSVYGHVTLNQADRLEKPIGKVGQRLETGKGPRNRQCEVAGGRGTPISWGRGGLCR
jgi:hypothetical protein